MREIDAPDGRMRVYDVAGPRADSPTVILFADVLGLHAEILEFARRIGGRGYRCLAPDVYYREHQAVFRGIEDTAAMLALGRRLRTDLLVDDIRTLVRYATQGDPGARLGAIGFCRGGSQAVLAAGAAPDAIVSAIAVYPTRLLQDTPDTGYSRWFGAIKADLRFLCPEADDLMPPADVDGLAAQLDRLGTSYQIRVYPGATHGWNFASRPEYHRAADTDTWRIAFADWDRLLRGGPPSGPRQRRVVVRGRGPAPVPAAGTQP
jgi:carboxymethylenebutenolidase